MPFQFYNSDIIICNRLTRRVDRMEKAIGSIVTKIDTVIVKLETMERNKVKRRDAMTKILGTITQEDGGKLSPINRGPFMDTINVSK